MKIALVHDYLAQDGGAEKVLEVLQSIWPDAPTYTLFFDPKRLPAFAGKDIRTSFLQHLPLSKRLYQWYLPLMPTATEWLDVSDYDVVVSSSSAFSKGIITRDDALHICYCHTPTRYLWSDTHSYVRDLKVPRPLKAALPPLLSRLRVWDRQAADRVDVFVANSATVKRRIKKYYRRDSTVIYPPVHTDKFSPKTEKGTYFVTGGRLVAYKRFDLVVQACNKTRLPLKIFGSGPVERALKKQAGSTVELLGRVSDERLAQLYANARAFIHPQEEDFGITPVEAMASGCPVIAYRRGGATETVKDGVTGIFFDRQCWEDLADTMARFNDRIFEPASIANHAAQFGKKRFQNRMRILVENAWNTHAQKHNLA